MDNNVERKICSFCGKQGRKGMRFAGGLGAMICEECVGHYYEVLHSPELAASEAKPPWESMSDAEMLSTIPLISKTADQVADFLIEWIQMVRARDLSWASVGAALGVSRQAAWERFAARNPARPSRGQAER